MFFLNERDYAPRGFCNYALQPHYSDGRFVGPEEPPQRRGSCASSLTQHGATREGSGGRNAGSDGRKEKRGEYGTFIHACYRTHRQR